MIKTALFNSRDNLLEQVLKMTKDNSSFQPPPLFIFTQLVLKKYLDHWIFDIHLFIKIRVTLICS